MQYLTFNVFICPDWHKVFWGILIFIIGVPLPNFIDVSFLLSSLRKAYEGCSLISAIGLVTRKSALPPESEH